MPINASTVSGGDLGMTSDNSQGTYLSGLAPPMNSSEPVLASLKLNTGSMTFCWLTSCEKGIRSVSSSWSAGHTSSSHFERTGLCSIRKCFEMLSP